MKEAVADLIKRKDEEIAELKRKNKVLFNLVRKKEEQLQRLRVTAKEDSQPSQDHPQAQEAKKDYTTSQPDDTSAK